MSILPIVRLGQPVLLMPAAPVTDPRAAGVQALLGDLRDTLAASGGIGLAAPQIAASLRVILALPITDRAERGNMAPLALINPELTPLAGAMAGGFEGCLSIPELRGWVPRHEAVHYRALDGEGRPVEGEARGLFARILQHEVDHLDGILFPMRMTDLRRLAFVDELPHLVDWMARQEDAA